MGRSSVAIQVLVVALVGAVLWFVLRDHSSTIPGGREESTPPSQGKPVRDPSNSAVATPQDPARLRELVEEEALEKAAPYVIERLLRGPFAASPDSLMEYPAVWKELGLSDDQKARISDWQRENKEAREWLAASPFLKWRESSEEDRKKKIKVFQDVSNSINVYNLEKLESILDAKQNDRLRELVYQHMGPATLFVTAEAKSCKDLGISAEQFAQIAKIQKKHQAEIAKIREKYLGISPVRDRALEESQPRRRVLPAPPKSEEERYERMAKAEKAEAEIRKKGKKALADMLDVLTEVQRAKFAEMKGEPFDFSQCTHYSDEQIARMRELREDKMMELQPYLDRLEAEEKNGGKN